MQEIFDRKAIFQRFAKINFDFSLHNKISSEILDEMQDYKVFFCKNCKNQENITQISGYQLQNCEYNTIILEENDQKNIAKIKNLQKNDGIVAISALHNVNYLQEHLMAIFQNLNADGVFCGNFFGVNNLSILKNIINESDLKHSKQIYPRFNPCISGENLYAILQSIGFENVVISLSKINFEFASFKDAMVFLYNINERNYVNFRQKTMPNRKIFQENFNAKVKLDFEIIKFYCQKK